jgi:hypothetical protein
MSKPTPADEARKRAERMAAFSSKVSSEEDAGVAVRSFNEAKAGSAGSKEYDPKTGAVRAGSGGSAPAPKANVKTVSDDELFAEIDAAVAAEEKKIGRSVTEPIAPPAEAPKPASPSALSAKRLAAMAAAAVDRPDVADTSTPAKQAAA